MYKKKPFKEKANDFLHKQGSMELILGIIVSGGLVIFGGMCYRCGFLTGKKIGAEETIGLVNKNIESVIFKAYDAGMDALSESIANNIPEAAEIITKYAEENPDWTTTVGDAVVNMLDGTFELK